MTEDVDSDEYQKFACAVFALLMRYESLGGAGYQSALAEDAFDVLNEKLGVSCECFRVAAQRSVRAILFAIWF